MGSRENTFRIFGDFPDEPEKEACGGTAWLKTRYPCSIDVFLFFFLVFLIAFLLFLLFLLVLG